MQRGWLSVSSVAGAIPSPALAVSLVLAGDDFKRTHHLVGLVLEDVTVPGELERGNQPRRTESHAQFELVKTETAR